MLYDLGMSFGLGRYLGSKLCVGRLEWKEISGCTESECIWETYLNSHYLQY